jgi:archaellum biogenesis ATPase FlaH/5S rRNA maturation endonuclease (ribonuclease M5)
MRHEHRLPRQGEIGSFLAKHVKWMKQYGDEIRFNPCPHCGDAKSNPSIQINAKTGLWRCFKCGTVGNFYQLSRAFNDPISDPYKDDVKPQTYDPLIIQKFMGEVRRPVHDGHYPSLLEYCENRGIGRDTLKAWRVSSKGSKALRWPIYDLIDGRWTIVNMKVRSIDPNSKAKDWFDVAGGQTDLLIGNHLINPNGPKRAIIFEGQWDAMTATTMGIENVFSLPSGATNVNVGAMLRFIPKDWTIYLCVDMDKAGDECAEKFYASLSTERLKRLRLPFKDLNEWYQHDPLIVEKDLFQTSSETDHFFLNDDESDFMTMDMNEKIDQSTRILGKTEWENFNDKICGGFYEGQTTSLLGQSGGGKTTWVNQVGCHIASMGKTVGLISVEGSRDSLKLKIQDTIRGSIEEDRYSYVKKHLLISKLHGIGITQQILLAEISKMILNGAKIIVVDNLDFICRNDHNLKSETYLKLNQIAIENKLHIIVVWQPNKISRDHWISSGDQKGYSMSLQDSDNYFTMNKTISGICIQIEKTRERGISLGQDKIWFDWDEKLRIYVEQIRFTKGQYEGKLINLF